MKDLEIIGILGREYNIIATSVEKIKGVYRIETSEQIYCLKIVKYELPHFLFILGAIKHLNSNGFEYVLNIIKTTEGRDYVKIGKCFGYLTLWIKGRECSYDNPIELAIAARKLGELHKASEGFLVTGDMKPRVGWFKWIEVYRTRRGEILDFKDRIAIKVHKNEVDIYYLGLMDEELKRCDRAIENLCNSNYENQMLKEINHGGFCHHDYAHHNVLMCDNQTVDVIDFDYCILDTHLHDLASLLVRSMKYGRWGEDRMRIILKSYISVHELEQDDIEIMAGFMEFPQDYWQRGIQYYWEEKSWGDEFFLKKLKLYADDIDDRQEFINKFRSFKLNNL
ncbi:CotS family spore coat protein [Clostridium sp.]|uniref:CotS family spore coat protein n=1 Tax=Clostridium sp. TaxID=1506 RepID=UPI0032170BEE